MSGLAGTLMALAMIAALVLAVAGIRLTFRADERQRGLLMIGAALVLLANVLIWTV